MWYVWSVVGSRTTVLYQKFMDECAIKDFLKQANIWLRYSQKISHTVAQNN